PARVQCCAGGLLPPAPPASYRSRRVTFLGLNNWGWRGVLFVRAKNWHRTAVCVAYGQRQFCGRITALSVVRDVADDRLTTVTDGTFWTVIFVSLLGQSL